MGMSVFPPALFPQELSSGFRYLLLRGFQQV